MLGALKDTLDLKPLVAGGSAVGLSYIELLPFWLRITFMASSVLYLWIKIYRVWKG